MQKNIKAVTFDLDDTFWPVWPAIGRAEQEMVVWLEKNAPQILEKFGLEGLQRLRDQVASRKPDLAHHISLMRILALREAAEQSGYSPSVGEQAFQVMWDERNRVELFDDVEPVLRWLKNQGLTLGALSNGNADIGRVGLGAWFDFALNALSGGAPKPDSAMFTKAATLAGCLPSQIVHVGDDLVSDVQGAAKAGMVTVWLNRSGVANAAAMADYEISSLTELPRVIDGLKGWRP